MGALAAAARVFHKLTKTPGEAWNTAALVRAKFTNDADLLHTRTHWLHFNYDAFTSEGERAIGFTNDEFCVWRKELGQYGYGHVALQPTAKDRRVSDNVFCWSNPTQSKGSYTFAPAARVRGVLERLPTADYFQLDTDLQNGVVFERRRVSILTPMQTIIFKKSKRTGKEYQVREMFVRSVFAWMYVGVEKAFSEGEGAIDAGYSYDIARISHPESFWIGDFYYAE